MNETAIVYIVHSDLDENNIFAMFEDEIEAIMYARDHKEDLTYVDKTEMSLDDSGDYDEVLSAETIWVYDEDDDPEDIEDEYELSDEELFNIDFDELERELDDEESWFEDFDADKLVETLEENEDIVECKECFELFPKQDCFKIEIGYVCPECGKVHGCCMNDEEEFEIDSIPDVVIADEDTFKIDFPETERFDFRDENEMIPNEPTPEVGPNPEPMPEISPNPEPMTEPCVGPECEAPVEAPVTKDETITKLVIDEHEAIDGYDKAKIEIEANSELDEKEKEEILDTIEHIKEEEIEHIEELEELVDEVEETKADEPTEESEAEDESKVLVETSVAIPDFKRSPSRNTSHSSYVFNYTDADFEALSHHLNLAYKRATTTPKISAATIIFPFSLFSTWNGKNATAYAIEMFTSKLQDCNTLEDIEIKLDPFFDYLGTESEYKNDIEFYDEVVSNFANALWELKTGTPVDKEGLDEKLINTNSDILTEASLNEGPLDALNFLGRGLKGVGRTLVGRNPDKYWDKNPSADKQIGPHQGYFIKEVTYENKKPVPTGNYTSEAGNYADAEKVAVAESNKNKKVYYIITPKGEGPKEFDFKLALFQAGKLVDASKDWKQIAIESKNAAKTNKDTNKDKKDYSMKDLTLTKDEEVSLKLITNKEEIGLKTEFGYEVKVPEDSGLEVSEKEGIVTLKGTKEIKDVEVTVTDRNKTDEKGQPKLISTFKVTVTKKAKDVSEYKYEFSAIELKVGETKIIQYSEKSDDLDSTPTLTNLSKAENTKVTSSNTEIALTGTVQKEFLGVKGIKEGKATITVIFNEETHTIEVTVVKAEESQNTIDSSEPEQEQLIDAYNYLVNKVSKAIRKQYVLKTKSKDANGNPIYKAGPKWSEYDKSKFTALLGESLSEETHARYAKPEGDRVAAYNNALKYAKKENKPFIYGYTNHTGKFFAAETPMKVTGSPADAEKEFRQQYKNCKVVYVVYPDKEFIESLNEEMYIDSNFDEWVRCEWCGELFLKEQCKYEVNFGWLCDRCQVSLRDHGGKLTFTDNYPEEEPIEVENIEEIE